jgi:hypothetical protein
LICVGALSANKIKKNHFPRHIFFAAYKNNKMPIMHYLFGK